MRDILKATAAVVLGVMAHTAPAAVIFSDDFNGYVAGGYGTQADTGLTLGAFGDQPNWIKGGVNAVHAEDRTGAGDWAPMFYGASGYDAGDQNSLLMATGIAANALGMTYTVAFEGAAAAYGSNAQANGGFDYLRFRVLDAGDAEIFSYIYSAPDWSYGSSNPFSAASFDYVGTGTGNIRLLIDAYASYDHFGGSIDNLSISGDVAAPEPAALGLLGLGLAGIAAARRKRR